MLASNLSHFIIDPSFFTYYSSLSLLFLWCSVQCYIGPCGVLVPIGTVHSNNELSELKIEIEIEIEM